MDSTEKQRKVKWIVIGIIFLCVFTCFLILIYYDTYTMNLIPRFFLCFSGISSLVIFICISCKLFLIFKEKNVTWLGVIIIFLLNIIVYIVPNYIYNHVTSAFATLTVFDKEIDDNRYMITFSGNEKKYIKAECSLLQYEKVQKGQKLYEVVFVKHKYTSRVYLLQFSESKE